MGTLKKEAKQVRVYLEKKDEAALEAATKAFGWTETAVMTLIASAGLRALQERGFRFPFPLTFDAVESIPSASERHELNEGLKKERAR